MRILVATASRYGSTREVGERLAATLAVDLERQMIEAEIDVIDVVDVEDIAFYDAAIIGSAVYFGRWLRPARDLIDREQHNLHALPVWLFSSGPVGDITPATGSAMTAPWAREHRTFPGKLDRSTLRRSERLFAAMLRAPDVDDRDFVEIDGWAHDIASSLAGSRPGRSQIVS
ncbi:flavodoxin domain-containing protein [Gordonia sp. PKS22-38]|uniref:Flavodoxin domain-containing protein n=1 Tax=Gordonia prachuapensis TaxID=3115651 RepID=A0ABU7MW58_9ACTN|nr:flavodoxin domain-containing protein [Gordonia sp. PKS22-38]